MEKLLLIDGNSLINRAFYALPPLSSPKGEPVQAVYGFTNMLIKSITDYNPKYIAVAFDLPIPTFRHEMYADYKAGRRKMPDDLRPQIPMLKELLHMMNITTVELAGYEADDIIGTLAKRYDIPTIILTGDRDSLQLIDDKTEVYLTKRGLSEISIENTQTMRGHFGYGPEQVIDYKALAGDSSDNIPGVAGIGEKTAVDLLTRFGDLEGVYLHLDELSSKLREKLENGRENALLSRTLGTIKCDVPIGGELSDYEYTFPFGAAVKSYFIEMAFKSLYKRDDIFDVSENELSGSKPTVESELKIIENESDLVKILPQKTDFLALNIDSLDRLHFAFDEKYEYCVSGDYSLFNGGLTLYAALASLSDFLGSEHTQVLLYDAKKMLKIANSHGVAIKCYQDIRLMRFLIDHLLDCETEEELLKSSQLPADFLACGLIGLYPALCDKLRECGQMSLYQDIELPLVEVLADMENVGICVDRSKMNEIGAKLRLAAENYTTKIYELAGEEFNINSPKQLAIVLFEKLSIPYPKKTKKYSTNAEVLELLQNDYPIVDYVLKYRTVAKLVGTYIDGIGKLIKKDGRIHTEFKQMMTATGRLSSVEPNLQNIPVRDEEGKELRAIFVADEGKILVSADYSQIELRLMAHFSGDSEMLGIYNRGGDIHAMTAAKVFGVPEDSVTDEMRRKAKAVNFGMIYGISEYGLAGNIHCSVSEAKKFMKSYFQHFPMVKQYMEKVAEAAKKSGEVHTLLGRRRRIPEILSSNFMTRSFGERAAMNTPLQGSAADIIKIAMIKVHERLKNMNSRLILQIHDELIVEADQAELDEVTAIITDCMENAIRLSVPLTVDVEIGRSWFDC